jgi:hypothetical protein
MVVAFFVLLAVIFSPVFPGKTKSHKDNGLNYIDNLFNTISKGSSYFIPDSLEAGEKYIGKAVSVKIKADNEKQAMEFKNLLEGSGAQVVVTGKELAIKGDIGLILKGSLADADLVYNNNGKAVADKYGLSEKQVLYDWWMAFKAIGADLTKQKEFKNAKVLANAQKKALEPAYNYYGVEMMKWQENIALILLALGFYVVYTLWYGFGIMYLFEGLGLKIGH